MMDRLLIDARSKHKCTVERKLERIRDDHVMKNVGKKKLKENKIKRENWLDAFIISRHDMFKKPIRVHWGGTEANHRCVIIV